MSKKSEASAEASGGDAPAQAKKKPAAKAKAKKAPAQAKKKPAARRVRSETIFEPPPVAAEQEDITDAVIVAETPVEPPREDTEETEAVVAAPALSDEERELASVYGEEMGAPRAAHGEYSDRQTRDEDRPMMPEINAREERRNQWQERRDRRKQRREERQQRREHVQGQGQGQGHVVREHRPLPQAQPQAQAQPINGHAAPTTEGPARVGTPLGDAAASVFAQLRNGQPLPVRQLAAMMRKRNLVQQDPEQLWPQLKAELLGDERSYRSLGLRPRIVYRGRDLFAPGPVAASATADAEADVAGSLSRLAGATHRALAARLVRASAAGFERLIHAYLVAAGYRDIDWVKRVGGISYAAATAPGIARTILISARSGDQAIDRRAIGELRVGVEAKDLVAGILFSPTELSEDAERELERAGRSIAVVCGAQLVAALVQTGVGVVSSAAPLHYVDDQLLDELLAG
ncbi:MAG TPA: restriction endonuclease [Kofleriaceae bacterium]|nr:restriction endonuclease [Kofleriaceae bacterium]